MSTVERPEAEDSGPDPLGPLPVSSLAAAALAHGTLALGRSFRLHRPRGAFCHAGWCQQCLVRLPRGGRALACCVPSGGEVRTGLAGVDPLRPLGMLAERLPAGAPVLVIGGSGLRMAVRERGLRPVSTAADRPQAVVEGYSPDVSYSILAEGGLAVAAGALFVASNGDLTLPSRRGRQPGNGSLIQVITTATGVRPLVAGKPEPPLHHESVLRTGAERPLAVGDRLDTDIEGARRVGADSLLVLTGVTGPAEVILAPPAQRPTYLAEDLAGLLEPHPDVTSRGGTFSCNGWTARLDGDRLELTGGGERIDGLRALCAAAWASHASDAANAANASDAANAGNAGGVTPESARAAVQRLDDSR